MDTIRERLTRLAIELTGYDPGQLPPSVPLVELGFDSLVLTQLARRIDGEFGVPFTFREFFTDARTLDQIAERIRPHVTEPDPEPAAAAPSRQASVAAPASSRKGGASGADGIEDLIRGQLEVMRRQLALISGESDVGAPDAAAPDASTDGGAAREKPAPASPQRNVSVYRVEEPTPHQEAALHALITEVSEATQASKAAVDRDRPWHADPRTAAGYNERWKELAYPIVVNRSEGPLLWDVDGCEYVDLLNGFGPIFLGHSPPFVVEAVRKQLEAGFEVGPQTPLAGEAARLFCKVTGMDRVSFVCTGSEAVQAAIRAARTWTGRDAVVVFSKAYHGNFDEVLVRSVGKPENPRTVPSAPGVPQRAVDDVTVLPYGDDASLTWVREHASKLAAVFVEPVQTRQPELQPREFLQALREITRDAGALLVFDEVVTGFRCHLGGAQAHFGIEADLATYGKVLGGGLPIGAVAGRRPYMDVFDGGVWQFGDESGPTEGVTFFAGTFVRHPLAIAAAHATLAYLDRAGPSLQERVNARTDRLASRLGEIIVETGAPIEVPHFSSILYFRPTEPLNPYNGLFFAMMRLEGVFMLEGFPSYLTAVHEDAHIERVVNAFRRSVARMQAATFWPAKAGSDRAAMQVPKASGMGAAAEAPPVPGARMGRDEHGAAAWFVEDPESENGWRKHDDSRSVSRGVT